MTLNDITAILASWARANSRRLGVLAGLSDGPSGDSDRRRLPSEIWAFAVAFVAFVAFVLVIVGAPSALRAPIVLGFLILAPGWAIVRLLDIPDAAMRVALTLGLSISIVGIITLIQAYSGTWHPSVMVLAGGLVAVLAACVEIVRGRGGVAR